MQYYQKCACPVEHTSALSLPHAVPLRSENGASKGDGEESSAAAVLTTLPEHLGWGSEAVSSVIRAALRNQVAKNEDAEISTSECSLLSPENGGASSQILLQTPKNDSVSAEYVKLYPDIALGMLRQEQTAVGRIWLLLRALDPQGRGWLYVDDVRAMLSRKGSTLRVCGWRRMRSLLQEGEGTFWQRDKTRIWLYSTARVATSLNVPRLTHWPVYLPLTVLSAGIGTVKAHFYASFHSGRRGGKPISRDTLENITGIPGRTQRVYEKVAGVVTQHNIAIGERYTPENVQKRAWLHGNACFGFTDHHGCQGPKKRRYIAWHLPNSYEGCHRRSPKGRMKKINRQIDLVNRRAQGNGMRKRLFYANGAQAAKAHGRSMTVDAFWYSARGRRSPEGLWCVLARQDSV
ncbi:MAG: hypothetical protein KC441_05365 [Anaerolineales bacterium]|nr:hypothetical protein [Anaerolineales bacterium]